MIAIKYLRNEVIDYREFKDTYEFAKWLVDQCKLEDIVIKDIKNIEESQQGLFFFRKNYKAYYERESEFCDKNVKCELWPGPGMVEFESKDC